MKNLIGNQITDELRTMFEIKSIYTNLEHVIEIVVNRQTKERSKYPISSNTLLVDRNHCLKKLIIESSLLYSDFHSYNIIKYDQNFRANH